MEKSMETNTTESPQRLLYPRVSGNAITVSSSTCIVLAHGQLVRLF